MPGAELVALFGDELPEVRSARTGMVVASGAKVSLPDIAQMLLAVAVVQLLEQKAAVVNETETRKMFRTRRTMMLQASEAGEGLAQRLLDGCRRALRNSAAWGG